MWNCIWRILFAPNAIWRYCLINGTTGVVSNGDFINGFVGFLGLPLISAVSTTVFLTKTMLSVNLFAESKSIMRPTPQLLTEGWA